MLCQITQRGTNATLSKAAILANSKAVLTIPMVGIEAVVVLQLFNMLPRDFKELDVQELQSVFEDSDIVYVGSHGRPIFSSP